MSEASRAPRAGAKPQTAGATAGKCGTLTMHFEKRNGRSVLGYLHRHAPLLVQQALYWDEALPGLPCVYVITTSGCVVQGDRFEVSTSLAAGAMAHITTQAATKIHAMESGHAAQSQQIVLADNAYLEFLPGPTIPHRHSRFITDTAATVDSSATLLCSEILMPGRKYHGEGGELFAYDLYSSTFTARRPDGSSLFTEKFGIEPLLRPIRATGVMGHFDVIGNVLVITPEPKADRILELVGAEPGFGHTWAASAGRLPNQAGVVYKVLGRRRQDVQTQIRRVWEITRLEVLGADIPPVRPWG
jgi:urease accessory protein